jgi:hypothetical protein
VQPAATSTSRWIALKLALGGEAAEPAAPLPAAPLVAEDGKP